MQFDLFNAPKTEISKIKLEELFEAYFACRSNKRSTINAIAFEVDYENNLVQLCNDINDGTRCPKCPYLWINFLCVLRECLWLRAVLNDVANNKCDKSLMTFCGNCFRMISLVNQHLQLQKRGLESISTGIIQ